jgi:phage-related minor tail protein
LGEAVKNTLSHRARALARLREFQGAQEAALQSTSAAGLLAQSTWKNVGDIIQDSLKGALRDLIKGTFDAEKALLAMYDKITDAAIDYLFELIKIQFRQQIIASLAPMTGGGGAGGILGMFLGGFAKGGAFKGGITPFADGGIVRGPTMFGLAGEAGDEAILPLERIGGKLGVNAVGGDGGSYTININAIDTQSGAQFLQKNSQQIINQLRQADRLNRGYGSVR